MPKSKRSNKAQPKAKSPAETGDSKSPVEADESIPPPAEAVGPDLDKTAAVLEEAQRTVNEMKKTVSNLNKRVDRMLVKQQNINKEAEDWRQKERQETMQHHATLSAELRVLLDRNPELWQLTQTELLQN